MKGFIRQRGEAWELRVYLGADPSGRRSEERRVGKECRL